MAELLKVNGNTVAPSQQIGRDVVFIGLVAANAVLNTVVDAGGSVTNLDLVRQVIDTASSITLIGTTATDTSVTFMVEGLGFGGPGSGVEPQSAPPAVSLQDQADAIKALVEAVNASALGVVATTLSHIEGIAFVVDVTGA